MLAHVLAAVTAPFAFVGRARTARHLFRFALAEHESMLELRAAAARSDAPERRALYLRHALDEERHATTFTRHASEIRRAIGRGGYAYPRTDCEMLFARLGETRFLAFVHLGERRGRAQFEAYQAFFARRGDAKLRAMFAALVEDEREHERYTYRLLVEASGGEDAARRELRRMATWEALRSWRRAGQGLARLFYAASMIVLYVTLLPFAIGARLGRATATGWRSGAPRS